MPVTISCLSIREPWASEIVDATPGPLTGGHYRDPNKWCENRTRRTTFHGRLYIHVPPTRGPGASPDCITSAIIGHVELVACLHVDELLDSERGACVAQVQDVKAQGGEWEPMAARLTEEQRAALAVAERYHAASWEHVGGPWCWIVSDPVRLERPVLNVKGKLNVWRHEITRRPR